MMENLGEGSVCAREKREGKAGACISREGDKYYGKVGEKMLYYMRMISILRIII